MRTFIMTALAMLALMIGGLFQAEAASALINQAKAQCIVGEQASGYLGIIPGKTASTELRREVRRVNQERKAVYADLARKNGVTEEVTAKLTAEKLINRAAPGHCVRGTNGEWVKK